MSRKRTIKLAALNIVLTPHPPGSYSELIRAAADLQRDITLASDTAARLLTAFEHREGGFYSGVVLRFLDLNVDAQWYNAEAQVPATDEELEKIRQIPPALKAHSRLIHYFFFPKEHRLVFVTEGGEGGITPDRMKLFFQRLFAQPELISKFGHISVTVEQSPEALEEIFNLARLDSLTIDVHRPNPDDGQNFENKVWQEMEQEGTIRKVIILESEKSESIHPLPETRLLAQVANSNGEVRATGRDVNGKRVKRKTSEHPRIQAFEVQDERESVWNRMLDEARKLIASLPFL